MEAVQRCNPQFPLLQTKARVCSHLYKYCNDSANRFLLSWASLNGKEKWSVPPRFSFISSLIQPQQSPTQPRVLTLLADQVSAYIKERKGRRKPQHLWDSWIVLKPVLSKWHKLPFPAWELTSSFLFIYFISSKLFLLPRHLNVKIQKFKIAKKLQSLPPASDSPTGLSAQSDSHQDMTWRHNILTKKHWEGQAEHKAGDTSHKNPSKT